MSNNKKARADPKYSPPLWFEGFEGSQMDKNYLLPHYFDAE